AVPGVEEARRKKVLEQWAVVRRAGAGDRQRATRVVAQATGGVGGATMRRKGQASKGPGSRTGDDDGQDSRDERHSLARAGRLRVSHKLG
ncbi:hypothetical protein U1Q18_032970, partial [Sarracenia purpurea var. burkii]